MTEKTEHIIEALAFLICADRMTGRTELGPSGADKFVPQIHRVPAAMFDGFEPFDRDDEESWVLNGKTAYDQPVWPVDCAVAHLYGEAQEEVDWPEGTWTFTRFKTLAPKEWRGVLHRFYPRMVDEMQMYVRPNGKVETVRNPYALLPDGTVISPARTTSGGTRGHNSPVANYVMDTSFWGTRGSHRTEDDVHLAIALIGGLMLRKRYLWSVLIGEGSGPRARLFTDVVGMREIFRLRDIPPGKARRAALLHWVREHWRKRRDPSANDRAWVKAHIRGVWSYQWNGLLCQIVPSESDIDLLEPPP